MKWVRAFWRSSVVVLFLIGSALTLTGQAGTSGQGGTSPGCACATGAQEQESKETCISAEAATFGPACRIVCPSNLTRCKEWVAVREKYETDRCREIIEQACGATFEEANTACRLVGCNSQE